MEFLLFSGSMWVLSTFPEPDLFFILTVYVGSTYTLYILYIYQGQGYGFLWIQREFEK